METEPRRFFVIGYPRSRTAWLSVLLDGGGVRCEHEASAGLGVDGIKEFFEANPNGVAGTCDSGLLFCVDELMEAYPDAYWVFIHRPSEDALSSMMADRPTEAASWLQKWPMVTKAYENAFTKLSGVALHITYHEINEKLHTIAAHCTGQRVNIEKAVDLFNLKITQIPPRPTPIPDTVQQSAIERLDDAGIDLTGLTVRKFEASKDLLMICEWGIRRGENIAALAPLLPPLGVVVEDVWGPAAVLFCRESYGIPAADLEFSVSRPGMTREATHNAMAFAVAACMELAGKSVIPECHYTVFRATGRPAIAKFLTRLGFEPYGPDNQQKLIYQKT